MEKQMMEAARDGDISVLYALIRQDSNLLDEIEKKSWVETPLHVAASHGKTQFCLEMMVLKSSFVSKLNQDGFTPLHLAIQQDHMDTALGLLNNSVSGVDIVRAKGKGGLTPLHCAAEKGNIELLLNFLLLNPRSMEDVTIGNETALHVALNNLQLDAFKILLGWVELGSEDGPSWEERFLNLKDHQGHTILDVANSKQLLPQVVSLVTNSRLAKYVDVSAANIFPPQNSEPPMSFLNDFTSLLSTDKRLNKAAYDGDTDALYAILREDRSILDRIDIASFVDTPLHIAASKGHTRFAKEIIKVKPSFAKKLNQDGFSPLHLAVQNLQSQTAIEFVGMNMELVSVKGKDDMTPLHCAAKMGSPKELLDKFLRASPQSIHDLTIRKETVLHIAVRHGNLDCLKFLWNWILNKGDIYLMGLTDDEGKNVCDIAENNQPDNLEIRKFLKRMEAPSKSQGSNNVLVFIRKLFTTLLYGRFGIMGYRQRLNVSKEERQILLVVYTLIATTTYQAVLSPPGGVWQGDPSWLLHNPDESVNREHMFQLSLVGCTVLQSFLWAIFAALNTITFALSLSHICYMLPNKPFLFLPLACWVLCYAVALYVISSGFMAPLILSIILFWWLDMPFNAMSLLQNQKFGRVLVAFLLIALLYSYFYMCFRFNIFSNYY